MKVLQVIDKLDVGGAEKVFITLTKLLKDAGVHVDALVFDASGDWMGQLDKRLHIENLNRGNKYSISTLKKLNTICSTYEIVHVHMRYCFVYVALAKKLFKGKYKIILHDHFGDIDINQHVPLKLKLFRPDIYIGVSALLQKWAIEKWKLHKNKTFVLRNTVLPVTYEVRQSHTPNAFMISNFRETKNITFAIALFKKLNWPLTIYGHINDQQYFDKAVAMISNATNIKFVTTAQGFHETAPGHNLAIHTAKSESGPLVLQEYMSAGILFIAYNTGEVAQTISTELGHLFMDNFIEEDWINRIKQVVNENLEHKLKDTFARYFSTDKYVSDCLAIYRSVGS